MRLPRVTPAKALAALLGLAVVLSPATMASAAKKAPARKTCSLKKKAKCKKAKLVKVKVGKVNLAGTDLRGAVITGATFNGTNLSGVSMSGATITNANFTNVSVARLDLSGATLRNVTFVNARGSAREAMARETACTNVEVRDGLFTYECTPGGVTLRGAVIRTEKGDAGVRFRKSSIPRSDFRGITRSAGGGVAVVGFSDGTDVSSSSFGLATSLTDAVFDFNSAIVQGAVMDGVWFSAFNDTDATNSTMLGARVIGGGAGLTASSNTLTGVRGLAGGATVSIVGPDGVVPLGLRTVQVREDGFFRPGVLCESLPCRRSDVAVDAPVVATAAGLAPLVLSLPGWDCTGPTYSVIDGTIVYRTTCSIAHLPPGHVSGSLSREPVRMVPVTATADSGVPATATAISRLSIVATPPGGGPAETTTCATASTCTRDVIPGSSVSVRAYDGTRVVTAQCPGANDATVAGPTVELACPGRVVDAALTGRFVVRSPVNVNINAVDSGNWAVATPVATLHWSVRTPGLDVAAPVNCDGRSICNTALPSGAAVQLSIGDPVLDTSGFCPGPGVTFYFRLPGTVGTCPEYTLSTGEDLRIETQAPPPPP